MTNIKDIIIIGSGPAGYTAGIYAKRSGLNPIIIQGMEPGGQLTQTTEIENFPGFKSIGGVDLMQNMENQARDLGVEIIFDTIKSVDFSKKPYTLNGEVSSYTTNSVIIATGSSAKYLGVQGEQEFKGFGVSACATCDGFFFKNQVVAVVGGGNTALADVLYLSNLAKKVYLIHRRNSLRGEEIMQKRIFSLANVEILWDSEVIEVLGAKNPSPAVNSLLIKNNKTSQTSTLNVDGLFVAIGHTPNTKFLGTSLDTDEDGYLITNNTKALKNGTHLEGIYAAGDVQDKIYRQAITSAGSGCIAALNAHEYLSRIK
ncbi:MAG: thioredoxin-disulfide reductase [Alphaproteobacteria bacterium]|jgi:thioredoxin reductase (NADPH)|nr:thioredoxin-disulfide reductase [Alphaproteobacteria bacterium]